MYRHFFKRFLDFIVATLAFLVLLPVFIIVAISLSISNRGTPFFFQLRPGKHGKIFRIIKFKTMNDRRDANGKLLPDVARLTGAGLLVRKTSLDEIPQLLNVMKGDMSLIGPRPLLVDYLPLYSVKQSRRHEIRPGMTGWAQVNGRNTIGWAEKFEYDVYYVDHLNVWLDLKIIYMTIIKVLRREDVNSATTATMSRFTGNNDALI